MSRSRESKSRAQFAALSQALPHAFKAVILTFALAFEHGSTGIFRGLVSEQNYGRAYSTKGDQCAPNPEEDTRLYMGQNIGPLEDGVE